MGQVFAVEVRDDLRGIMREPAAFFFSIVMPVVFFLLFVSIFGHQQSGGMSVGTTMLATFGAYGVLAVTLMNPGIGIARDRDVGWLRAKRVSAVPVGVTLAAKVTSALPYALGVLAVMTLTAGLTGTLAAPPMAMVRLFAVLLLGALPSALFGLAVGFRVSGNAAAAILTAVLLPCSVLSGLWLPLSALPAFFGRIAQFLPTYHLGQLALAQLSGGPMLVHLLVLIGWTALAAGLAALSYRYARL
jgi:ABC-2 type transport system permease protein